MTLSELVDLVARNTEYDRHEAWELIQEFFETVVEVLLEGDDIKIRGFGTFYWKAAAPRSVTIPGTTDKVDVPEKLRLRFNPSAALKEGPGGQVRSGTRRQQGERSTGEE